MGAFANFITKTSKNVDKVDPLKRIFSEGFSMLELKFPQTQGPIEFLLS